MPVRFVRPRMVARLGLLAATVAAAACQGTATQTSPIFITDVFTGTVVTGSPGIHQVKTNALSATVLGVVDLTPNTGVSVGVGLGSPPASGGPGCNLQVFKTMKVGETFEVSGVPGGTFCLAVFEFVSNGIGAIPDPLAYTVKFSHH